MNTREELISVALDIIKLGENGEVVNAHQVIDELCAQYHIDRTRSWSIVAAAARRLRYLMNQERIASDPRARAAQLLGRARTPRKAEAARRNGRLGGRPRLRRNPDDANDASVLPGDKSHHE